MNRTGVVSIILFGYLLYLTGCAATAPPVEPENMPEETPETVTSDSVVVRTGTIHVLVDGRDRGILPTEIQIRRSFGIQFVSLYDGEEEFRFYELETYLSSSGQTVLDGFWQSETSEGTVYDVRHLEKKNEDYFYIPYTTSPIIIEDHTYNLTIRILN